MQTKPYTKHGNRYVCCCCSYIDISLVIHKLTCIITMETGGGDVTRILLFFRTKGGPIIRV